MLAFSWTFSPSWQWSCTITTLILRMWNARTNYWQFGVCSACCTGSSWPFNNFARDWTSSSTRSRSARRIRNEIGPLHICLSIKIIMSKFSTSLLQRYANLESELQSRPFPLLHHYHPISTTLEDACSSEWGQGYQQSRCPKCPAFLAQSGHSFRQEDR